MSNTQKLQSIRQKLWPIQRFEFKKLFPLILMKFLVSLVYSILTCMKDTLIVTANGSGAEVIPILKGWVVLPFAVLVTLVYTKLSNVFKRSTLFYLTLLGFLIVFVLYGFFLYPNEAALRPNASADLLSAKFGERFIHWIAVYRHWIQSLFFVTAELWAGLVIFILFWGYANHITTVGEAKRTYTLCIAAGDVATFASGPLVYYYAQKYANVSFIHTMQSMLIYVIIFTVAIMVLHYYLERVVLKDPRFALPEFLKKENKKTKLSLYQSLKHIGNSKYLMCIALMVVSYGLCINLVEVNWKAHLKMLHPDPASYQAYVSFVTTLIGFSALVTVLFVGGSLLRNVGWHFCAQITPIIVGVTGVLFFTFVLFEGALARWISLSVIVGIGAFQNIASKVMKYSFFDPTKEIAYIPLDHESKIKGKAAIDVVGGRFGKSGSSWVQIGLLDLFATGSILSITPLVAPILTVATICWILAVRYVNKEFEKKQSQAPV